MQELASMKMKLQTQQQEIEALSNNSAGGGNDAALKALSGLKVSLLGYAEYDAGQSGKAGDTQSSYNKFTLSRGYLTITKRC